MWYAQVALKLLQTRQELEGFLNSCQESINIGPQAATNSRLGMLHNADDPLQARLLYDELFKELARG
jgi:hypothetical protein